MKTFPGFNYSAPPQGLPGVSCRREFPLGTDTKLDLLSSLTRTLILYTWLNGSYNSNMYGVCTASPPQPWQGCGQVGQECSGLYNTHVLSWTWKSGRTSSGPRALAMQPRISSTRMHLCAAALWSHRMNMSTASSVLYALRALSPVNRLDFHVRCSTCSRVSYSAYS